MKKPSRNLSKCLALIVILVMSFSLSACGQKTDAASTSLYAQGLEIVQILSEMTRNEDYVDLYTGDPEIHSIGQTLGAGEYVSPKAVYAISIPRDALADMAALSDPETVSEPLQNFLMQRTFASLMTQINGMSGVKNLAAASIFTASKSFVSADAPGDVIYIYTYENAAPIAVTFTVGEEQTVSAVGVFLMYDGFHCESAEKIESFFSENAIPVDVSEVHSET